jgi:hypothetical protein
LSVLALLLAFGLHAAPAQAQLSRTFVSAASGSDANNCDRPTPCRTFQGAHDKTNDQGEITVLDPGGYGGVTITKSVSIVNDGVGEASILVSGGATGITVTGGPATYVNLRGITVQGIGFGGGSGLLFTSGFSLTVTNCVFRGHSDAGFAFIPSVSGTSNLSMSNTWVADNLRDAIDIAVNATGVTARVAMDGVHVVNNGHTGVFINGFNGTGTLDVAVTDSVSAQNAGPGFDVFSSAGKAKTTVTLIRSTIVNNDNFAFVVSEAPTAILRVGQSTVTGNLLVFALTGAVLQSFGDNYIAGNGNDPPLPTIVRK